MNSHEAGEGWLQIGDNIAGLYQPAGEVGAAIGGAEQVADVDVSSAHQFFESATGNAGMTQFPEFGIDMGGAPTVGADAALSSMPTGAESQLSGNGMQMINGLLEMASAIPGGSFLSAILSFLQMLFSPQNLAGMLDPSALYAQAASAAEMLRKGVQP